MKSLRFCLSSLFVHTIAAVCRGWYLFGVSINASVATPESVLGDAPKPVIGVPTPVENATWRVWKREAHLLSSAYAERLWSAGAIPVMLPIGGSKPDADQLVDRLDALVLPGGGDVDPGLYGAVPHPAAGPFDRTRDDWEAALAHAALARDIPILGICRGMQLLNVMLGGTLIQHLPDVVDNESHNPTKDDFGIHSVTVSPDSLLAEGIGTRVDVPSYHHQAVDDVSSRFRAVAWAEDGTIEALEDADGRILAVQWHPEVAEHDSVITHFVTRIVGNGASRGVAAGLESRRSGAST
ncbi:gamma-glutamyl-gamma-aminobutyrate hydrolase family protein [Prescottella defluvii]|nr:gamma-glutamyl-gamma-aminobutyrate hydrolase family protein [Prescottella defluvii]